MDCYKSCSKSPQYQLVTHAALAHLTKLLDLTIVCMSTSLQGNPQRVSKIRLPQWGSSTRLPQWGSNTRLHIGFSNTRLPQWGSSTRLPQLGSNTRLPQWVVQSMAPSHYQIVITLPPPLSTLLLVVGIINVQDCFSLFHAIRIKPLKTDSLVVLF